MEWKRKWEGKEVVGHLFVTRLVSKRWGEEIGWEETRQSISYLRVFTLYSVLRATFPSLSLHDLFSNELESTKTSPIFITSYYTQEHSVQKVGKLKVFKTDFNKSLYGVLRTKYLAFTRQDSLGPKGACLYLFSSLLYFSHTVNLSCSHVCVCICPIKAENGNTENGKRKTETSTERRGKKRKEAVGNSVLGTELSK